MDVEFGQPEDYDDAVSRLSKEINQLKADLAKFGGHKADCACLIDNWPDDFDSHKDDEPKCDCDWVEIENEIRRMV